MVKSGTVRPCAGSIRWIAWETCLEFPSGLGKSCDKGNG